MSITASFVPTLGYTAIPFGDHIPMVQVFIDAATYNKLDACMENPVMPFTIAMSKAIMPFERH
jgi:hypothetical protein